VEREREREMLVKKGNAEKLLQMKVWKPLKASNEFEPT